MATTKAEDDIIAVCKAFGGAAADCADIVVRLDERLEVALVRIQDMADEIKELEQNQ